MSLAEYLTDWAVLPERTNGDWLTLDAGHEYRAVVYCDGWVDYEHTPNPNATPVRLHIGNIDAEIQRLQEIKRLAAEHFRVVGNERGMAAWPAEGKAPW